MKKPSHMLSGGWVGGWGLYKSDDGVFPKYGDPTMDPQIL